jgi:hypothetical protein
MTLAALAAFFTYRRTTEPAIALVGVGAACVAANFIMFDLIARKSAGYLFIEQLDTRKGADLMGASLVSWSLFAIALLAAVPSTRWAARSSIGLRTVAGVALGAFAILGVLDLAIFFVGNRPGPAEQVLGWIALALSAAAASRLTLARGEPAGWLATAAALSVGIPAAWLLAATPWLEDAQVAITWYLTVPFVVGTMTMFACLSSVHRRDVGDTGSLHET